MPLTGGTIREALAAVRAVGGQMRNFDELAAGASDALRQAPGLTPAGAACFLGTQAQESDYFRTTEEYAKNGRYKPYIGRGFEMVTWEGNYGQFGGWCNRRGLLADPEQFRRDPRSLADYRWAWLTGVWYFEANALWQMANRGDMLGVSQAVNGGKGKVGSGWKPNGWAAREAMFNAFMRHGGDLLPGGAPMPSAPARGPESLPDLRRGMQDNPVLARLQDFCNKYPWRPALEVIPADGDYGPRTTGVIRGAALQMGIPEADGENVGPKLKAGFWRLGFRG